VEWRCMSSAGPGQEGPAGTTSKFEFKLSCNSYTRVKESLLYLHYVLMFAKD
jgi:hypothetical protein